VSVFNGKIPEKILCIAFEGLYRMLRLKSSENQLFQQLASKIPFLFLSFKTDLKTYLRCSYSPIYDGNRIIRTLRLGPSELSNKRSSSESYGWADAMTSSSSILSNFELDRFQVRK
jgi:hypothetical protein